MLNARSGFRERRAERGGIGDPRESFDIVLVGCGAVGVSLLANLEASSYAFRGSIVIVDPAKEPGRGIAYGRDANSNLLNRSNASISVRADDLREFFRWFADERVAGRLAPCHRAVPLDPDGHAPRPLFGDYLASRHRRALATLTTQGWCVEEVCATAVEVLELDGKYAVALSTGKSLLGRAVVFATGNGPSAAYHHFEGMPGYIALPYPNEGLSRRIGAEAPIAILGSRLSAVDTALALAQQGHRGPIFMVSRSGQLPMAGAGKGGHMLSPTTLEAARLARSGGTGSVTLFRLMRIMLKEIVRAEGERLPVRGITRPELTPTQAFLAAVEERAAGLRKLWQDALMPFNDYLADFWNALPDDDRRTLMRGAYGTYMGYRVAIPMENARRLADLLMTGRVENMWPLQDVRHDGHTFALRIGPEPRSSTPSRILRVPVLVNCTGLAGGPDTSGGALYPRLLSSGLARRHPFGGIDVDPCTNRLRGKRGTARRLFAIGNSTQGVFLLTSNLVLNAAHAARVAQLLLADLDAAARTTR